MPRANPLAPNPRVRALGRDKEEERDRAVGEDPGVYLNGAESSRARGQRDPQAPPAGRPRRFHFSGIGSGRTMELRRTIDHHHALAAAPGERSELRGHRQSAASKDQQCRVPP